MTITTLMNALANIVFEYGPEAEIDTITLIDGDWMAISGWGVDRDGEDVEIDKRYNGAGVELSK